jgi:hypothetical protein
MLCDTRLPIYLARKQEMPIPRIVSELLVNRCNRRHAPNFLQRDFWPGILSGLPGCNASHSGSLDSKQVS